MAIGPSSKKKHLLVGAIIIAIVVCLCVGCIGFLPNIISNNKTPAPTLLFSDEFNEASLDTQKWQTCFDSYSIKYQGCTNYGNWESEWYKSSQVKLLDGNLILTAEKQKIKADNKYGGEQNYEYVSGMISTGSLNHQDKPKWKGKYGLYEARILVPSGQAVWPAFWLLPADHNWPPEIDIMETLGQRPDHLLNTYFWKNSGGQPVKDSSTYTYTENLSNNWHVYAVNWQPGSIEWLLDGKIIKSVKSDKVPSENMQIILNLAVGGTLPGGVTEETPSRAIMLVDYIRVYKN